MLSCAKLNFKLHIIFMIVIIIIKVVIADIYTIIIIRKSEVIGVHVVMNKRKSTINQLRSTCSYLWDKI